MSDDPTVDRSIGALVGLAVGDALGAAVEFARPAGFAPVTGFRAGGPHGLAAGEWTDDTSMALALADSIAEVGWDLDDQARRYVDWWQNGTYSVTGDCFDIGGTTRRALARFTASGDARTSGEPGEQAAGNGSIMRLAPVPIRFAGLYPGRLEELVDRCVESSLPTHRAPQALSACAVLGVMLAALTGGEPPEVVVDPAWPALTRIRAHHPLHPAVEEVVAGSYLRREPPEIAGTGYVVACLEAALWAFARHDGFAGTVLAAVNLGDDADTTGAVAGQLAGACYGLSGIPAEWRAGLAQQERVEQAARRLLGDGGPLVR
jgi:ADP-ribosyl-[dinitrogen reductase] hydrolase